MRRRRRASGPSPTTTSGRRRRLKASHGDVDALVGHQLGDDQVVVAHRAGREALGLDRRVEDGRVAVEVARDPPLGRVRVGDVAVDALGGDPVPLAPAAEDVAEPGAHERVEVRQRRLALVPGVAKRVVAVADVDRVLVDDHAVRPGAGARDHHVVARAGRSSRPRRGRSGSSERNVRAVGAQPLEERRVDVAMRETALRAPLVVDGGEHVGVAARRRRSRRRHGRRRARRAGSRGPAQSGAERAERGPASARV